MGTESVDVMIEGGKATAAPPLGPALGPLKVNIGQVVNDINQKTQDLKGMQVPVKVTVDTDTKEYSIKIGTPPASALVKKEAEVDKGASNAMDEKVAELKIEQIIKIATMKKDGMLGKDNFSRVKEVLGTCYSIGVLVEGKDAKEITKDINQGAYKDEITSGKTELTEEERKEMEKEKERLKQEIDKKRSEYEKKAKEVMEKFKNKEPKIIRAKLKEAGIPAPIINELVGADKKK